MKQHLHMLSAGVGGRKQNGGGHSKGGKESGEGKEGGSGRWRDRWGEGRYGDRQVGREAEWEKTRPRTCELNTRPSCGQLSTIIRFVEENSTSSSQMKNQGLSSVKSSRKRQKRIKSLVEEEAIR